MSTTPEDCRKAIDDAFETLNKDQAEYDKQILTLSAAFLGVSLAFVKDVVPLKDAVRLWELDFALGFLLMCICLVLATFQYSIHGHFRLVDFWALKEKSLDASDANTNTQIELDKLWTSVKSKSVGVRRLNWTSGVLFVAGVILLVFFVITNVNREAHLPVPQNCAQNGGVK